MNETWKTDFDSTANIHRKALKELSEFIWSNPEEKYEEIKAHDYLTEFFQKRNFKVTKNLVVSTGSKAEFVKEKLEKYERTVSVICEYDALPTIGHACGHNLIATCGALAGLIVKHFIETDPEFQKYKLIVLGTPAEEGGGGKVKFIEAGVFKDIDISVMAHPSPVNGVFGSMFARRDLKLRFHGKEAHAAGYPWKGVNALDAAVVCYSSISNMRHQFKPDWRVHGIFTNGGAKPNIIPATAELYFYVRTKDQEDMEELYSRMINCGKGAALSTGCTFEHWEEAPSYKTMITNPILGQVCASLMDIDFELPCAQSSGTLGSTDMGNVSHEIPAIHPRYSIGEAVNHTKVFTVTANSDFAFEQTIKMGKVLAATVLTYLSDEDIQKRTHETF